MPTRQEYVDGVKAALKTLGVQSATTYINSMIPGLLEIPILGWFLKRVIEHYWEFAIEKGDYIAFVYFIDARTSSQGRDWFKAVDTNRLAQKFGTQEQKDAAVKGLKEAHDRLVDLRL